MRIERAVTGLLGAVVIMAADAHGFGDGPPLSLSKVFIPPGALRNPPPGLSKPYPGLEAVFKAIIGGPGRADDACQARLVEIAHAPDEASAIAAASRALVPSEACFWEGLIRFRFSASDVPREYSEWTRATGDPSYQLRLQTLLARLIRDYDSDLGLACPDPEADLVTAPESEIDSPYQAAAYSNRTYLYSRAQAFDVFAAHVAHALALEARRSLGGGLGPSWSLTTFGLAELAEIFDSFSYFVALPEVPDGIPVSRSEIVTGKNGETVEIRSDRLLGQHYGPPGRTRGMHAYLVCDPRDGYRFMRGLRSTVAVDLLAATPEITLGRLIDWYLENVFHTSIGVFPSGHINAEVSSDPRDSEAYLLHDLHGHARLRDRLLPWSLGTSLTPVNVAGCQGAVNLFYDLARSVNIPVRPVRFRMNRGGVRYAADHGLAYRWTSPTPRLLTHMDDFYLAPAAHTPIDAAGRVLAGEARWRALFESFFTEAADLERYGAEVRLDLPVIHYSRGGAVTESSREAAASHDGSRADYGYWGGSWRFREADGSGSTTDPVSPSTIPTLDWDPQLVLGASRGAEACRSDFVSMTACPSSGFGIWANTTDYSFQIPLEGGDWQVAVALGCDLWAIPGSECADRRLAESCPWSLSACGYDPECADRYAGCADRAIAECLNPPGSCPVPTGVDTVPVLVERGGTCAESIGGCERLPAITVRGVHTGVRY